MINKVFENKTTVGGKDMFLIENVHDPEEEMAGFWLYIPRSHARMETSIKPRIDNVPENDRYEFYVFRQTGTPIARRNTLVLYKLPSGRKVGITLFMDGGVDWVKEDRKFMLRETDELDRRIILGFCYKYQVSLVDLSHMDFNKPSSSKRWMEHNALDFVYKMVPKRIKRGSFCNDFTDDYKAIHALDPMDESKIFKNVQFINSRCYSI